MKRRTLLGALGAAALGTPFASAAQTAKTPPTAARRVAVLAPSTRESEERNLKPFFERMRELGWIEGQNVVYERSYADNQMGRLLELAQKLVARNPDVIYAPPAEAARAARTATGAIPIVFGSALDPVGTGLIKSFARPGGNVTGVSTAADVLAPKRLQLLTEALPAARRIGILFDQSQLQGQSERMAFEQAAVTIGVTVIVAAASDPRELESAVQALLAQKVDAIAPVQSSLFFNLRKRVVELAGKAKVPVIAHRTQNAEDGALLAYGPVLADQIRRSADLVDKVLKGADPAVTPVELATKFETAVNLKTARSLGITLPPSILLRAERVIE